MPDRLLDLVDDTFIVAPVARVAALVRDPASWRRWWPDLDLAVSEDRGRKGVRWELTGALVGTSEIWLEPFRDGVIVHYYLRVDAAPGSGHHPPRRRAADRMRRGHALAWKRVVHAMKDELERGRPAGMPRVR